LITHTHTHTHTHVVPTSSPPTDRLLTTSSPSTGRRVPPTNNTPVAKLINFSVNEKTKGTEKELARLATGLADSLFGVGGCVRMNE
jgi:hypothetical protein